MSDALRAPAVLVVEDNPAMRALIRSLVEGRSSVVYECADGAAAVDLYEQVHPDWVLMDIKLEGLDGISATRAIRRADPAARVIIVTENRDREFRQAANDAGACGFVLKENLLDLPGMLEGEGGEGGAGGGTRWR